MPQVEFVTRAGQKNGAFSSGTRVMMMSMEESDHPHYLLVRDGTILVRLYAAIVAGGAVPSNADYFDVRAGVQLKEIHPPLHQLDIERATRLSEEDASSLVALSADGAAGAAGEFVKVVSLLEVKQRRLDSVVADSILDQVRRIKEVLQTFLNAASRARDEERFWLAQQVLPLLGKFSGRELTELEELAEWFRKRPGKK